MSRFGWIATGLAAAWLAWEVLNIVCMRGVFVNVPNERDSRLVGKWQGVWTDKFPGVAEVVLQPDGTANGPYFDRARWGTEKGILRVKTLATDAWMGVNASYTVASDGRSVKLGPKRNYQLPNKMTRP